MGKTAKILQTEKEGRWFFFTTLGTLALGLIFLSGIIFQRYKPWPYPYLLEAKNALIHLARVGVIAPDGAIVKIATGSSREQFKVHQPAKLLTGYRAVMGYDHTLAEFNTKTHSIKLFDDQGQIKHVWPLYYNKIDADGPSGGGDWPHAFQLMKDGSVIVNFDRGDAMARFDSCGKPMWITEGNFHHSLEIDDQGALWTWRGHASAYSQYQYIVKIDPESGAVLSEINLVEDIIHGSDEAAAIFSITPGIRLEKGGVEGEVEDIFHPNDIEILSADLADMFPLFEPGYLLVSLRKRNLVAVIDPHTYIVKWWRSGPWVSQHDPDFTGDGKISVYNNNTNGKISNIVLIDPVDRSVKPLFSSSSVHYYSGTMGKHRYLPGNRIQIVVPSEGRILEFDQEGNMIIEINNVYSTDFNGFVADSTWVPANFFALPPWTNNCRG